MTEFEWLSCADPEPMLEYLQCNGTISERKIRLFAVACCRRVWMYMTDGRSRTAVEVAERFADGLATQYECKKAFSRALPVSDDAPVGRSAPTITEIIVAEAAADAAVSSAYPSEPESIEATCKALTIATLDAADVVFALHGFSDAARREEQSEQCRVVRDIFGNPFRPERVDPAWLTPSAITLATAIYDERSFHRMPQLADVLEEAGCSDAGILGHCRSLTEHVRGCWVVDAVLGKA